MNKHRRTTQSCSYALSDDSDDTDSDTSVWSSGSFESRNKKHYKINQSFSSDSNSDVTLFQSSDHVDHSSSSDHGSPSRGDNFYVLLQVKKRTYRFSINAKNFPTFIKKIEKRFHRKFPGKIINDILLETGKNKYCRLENEKVSFQYLKSRKVIAIKIKCTTQKEVVMPAQSNVNSGKHSV